LDIAHSDTKVILTLIDNSWKAQLGNDAIEQRFSELEERIDQYEEKVQSLMEENQKRKQ
jgi:hypothetical protein